MPNHLLRAKDTPLYVKVNSLMSKFWNSTDISSTPGLKAGDYNKEDLGHTDTPQTSLVIVGANAPTPRRVVKILPQNIGKKDRPNSISTFVSFDKQNAATTSKWKISKQEVLNIALKPNTPEAESVTAILEITASGSGAAAVKYLYVYTVNKADFDDFAVDLGWKASSTITNDTERRRLVRGSSFPKPGKAQLKQVVTSGTGNDASSRQSTRTFMCGDDAPLDNGWSRVTASRFRLGK